MRTTNTHQNDCPVWIHDDQNRSCSCATPKPDGADNQSDEVQQLLDAVDNADGADSVDSYEGPDEIDKILAELQGYMINVIATMKAKQAIRQYISDGIGEDEKLSGNMMDIRGDYERTACNQLRQEIRNNLLGGQK